MPKISLVAAATALMLAGVGASVTSASEARVETPAAARINPPSVAVPERQPVVTALSATASAMTFWVIESDGWRVVTIVDLVIVQNSDAEQHAVVRFSSVLLPGQSQLISVPLALGQQQQVLRIRRFEDQIRVERIPGV